MKVNLEKELSSKKKVSQHDAEEFMQDVKLLLDGRAKEERDALTFAGLDSHIIAVETAKGVEMERDKFEDRFNGKVFTEDEIQHICMKYDLRFLQASRFEGKIDQSVALKLAKFRKDNEVGLGHNESNRFFIVAPATSFKLNDRPAKVRPPKGDPLLFYKINENNYLYLHKWGIDFTVFRRLMGVFFKSKSSMWACTWSIIFAASMLIRGFSGFGISTAYDLWMVLAIAGMSVALTPLALLIMFKDGEDWDDRTTTETWNSGTRRSRW